VRQAELVICDKTTERPFDWIDHYQRFNIIFERTKEHLVGFTEIAFVSILTGRVS